MSLYQLVYGKSCHLPLESKNKALWASKSLKYDISNVGEEIYFQLHELEELQIFSYKNPKFSKKKQRNSVIEIS